MIHARTWSTGLILAAAGVAIGALSSPVDAASGLPAVAGLVGRRPEAASTTASAEGPPEDLYGALVPPDTGDLPARVADYARRCAAVLATGKDGATQAQERVLAVQRAVLATLDSYADDPDLEVRLRVAEVLEEAVVEARVTRMEASLPASQRSLL